MKRSLQNLDAWADPNSNPRSTVWLSRDGPRVPYRGSLNPDSWADPKSRGGSIEPEIVVGSISASSIV